MHNNFYFLRQLSTSLDHRLVGFSIVSCFTQNKDELVLEFNNGQVSHFLKASLLSNFCCLSFPAQFKRARKNSLDLFPSIVLKKLIRVHQYENERCFSLELDSGIQLLFKMHGNRANIILLEQEKAVEIFRNHLLADFEINPHTLDRTIDWSHAYFSTHQEVLKKSYFTFGTEVWRHMNQQGFEQASLDQRWRILQSTLKQLDHPRFYIIRQNNKLVFTLFPSVENVFESDDPVEALNRFYLEYLRHENFSGIQTETAKQLEQQIAAGEHYIRKNLMKLEELEENHHHQQWADLIMANLDQIRMGMDHITVTDFYHDDRPVDIQLRKDMNAQDNANALYRKSKDRQIELRKLRESIIAKEKELNAWQARLSQVKAGNDTADFGQVIDDASKEQRRKEEKKSLPYHEFTYHGFKIWVGKDAKSNDTLTLKHSYKDDLWLHAKDVAGSHVLVKHQAGKNFPREVIERAAELAAYNSKRKTDTLCPVTVTPKKYVRKRKGDPAGAVIVEREDVVLVTPKLGVTEK